MTLLNGDCLELLPTLLDKSVDMVLTDPPYGTTACKWDSVIPFEPMWRELKRIVKPNGAICLFGSEPFSSALRMSNIKMFKYDWVWDKVTASGFAIAKICPLKQHELISVFGRGRLNYIPQMSKMDKPENYKCYAKSESSPLKYNDGKRRTRTHKYPKTILSHSNANRKGRLHPTQKPVALLEYLIKTYTLKGETVLDFTMGSGSTGVAAKNLKRKFIGIELDDNYYKVAKKRIGK